MPSKIIPGNPGGPAPTVYSSRIPAFTAYTIKISEGQRQLLMELMRGNYKTLRAHQAKAAGLEIENLSPTALISMLRTLPDEEAKNPGIVHGLCL